MKRTIAAIVTLVISAHPAYAQNPAGHYEGAVSRDGSVQLVKADFATFDGKLTGTFDIPELMVYDVPIKVCEWHHDTLLLNLNYGNFFCRYFPATDEITGTSEEWLPKVRLHLKRIASKVEQFHREEIAFSDKEIRLAGLLLTPKSTGPCPFVVLIHGSGSADRLSPYYHSLGYILAEHGIGVLLYDKRGCGESTGDWNTASMWDLADDAAAGLRFLRARKDLKILKLGLLGTSQGGWITTIAAHKSQDCEFAILNVGPSVSVFDQDIDRVKYTMAAEGVPESAIDSAVKYTKLYFRYAGSNAKSDWESLTRFAEQIRGREWASFVNFPENKDDFTWWRNNNYDPGEDLKTMPCPVLSILAEKDALVPPKENQAKMDSLLRLSKVPYEIKVIPAVGHDELTFQSLNGETWKWPHVYWQWRKRPEMLLETIITWIHRVH